MKTYKSPNYSNKSDVIVIQQGARRNYIYAAQLESHGLLHSLATDAAWSQKSNMLVRWMGKRFFPRREITTVNESPIYVTFLPNLIGSLARRLISRERFYSVIDDILGLYLIFRVPSLPKVVVNYAGNGGMFLRYMRKHGAKIVTDFVITPLQLEIQRKECLAWPDWGEHPPSMREIEYYRTRTQDIIRYTDRCLCPSPSVAKDLQDHFSVDPAKISIVPYGASGVLLRRRNPVYGRVLFAGAAGLRKGLPYLALAATKLKALCPEIEIRVAGAVSDKVRSMPIVGALNFLGHLGRDEMANEMSKAEVFCLPSLAEGSATAIFEALANGLPVVTTAASGSIIRDGVEGFIVPVCDSAAIADALYHIVRDRDLQARMSSAATAAAEEFSDVKCGASFIDAICKVRESVKCEEDEQ